MDKIYQSVANILTHQELLNAGYIGPQSLCDTYDLSMTTPLPKKTINPYKKNVVILTTGSFAPVHDGHVNLVKKAMNFAESQGYHVLGGYMSPSHDKYVAEKIANYHHNKGIFDYNKAYYDAPHRCHLIETALINDSDIFCDPWESLHNIYNINFTQVILRLEHYLSHYLNHPVSVIYAFGEDNIDFSNAFLKMGMAYCIARHNRTTEGYPVNKNVWFVENEDFNDFSSTQQREIINSRNSHLSMA